MNISFGGGGGDAPVGPPQLHHWRLAKQPYKVKSLYVVWRRDIVSINSISTPSNHLSCSSSNNIRKEEHLTANKPMHN